MLLLWLRGQAWQVLEATRFLSRLPVAVVEPAIPQPLSAALGVAPLAGVLIAIGPALSLVLAGLLGFPSLAGAGIAVGVSVLVTGALHEDGWADVADGFGGGRTAGRKLDIMRDSRIGTYGALAIVLSVLLRVASLQSLTDRHGGTAAALALVGAAAVSRGLMLVPLKLLPPARSDGLAQAALAGRVPRLGVALSLAVPLGLGLGCAALSNKLQVVAAVMLAAAASLAITRLARRHIGGVTGDVIGATQQAAEIVFLLTLCAGPRSD